MSKLWQKKVPQEALIERFTVGRDYLDDLELVVADCLASMAHAAMLAGIGILEEREAQSLHRELGQIIREAESGRFRIRLEEEDCHTAIENRLVARLGEAGKRIHTGRSRNDQVIAALRLYTREFLHHLESAALDTVDRLLAQAATHAQTPMPGRTHTQIAMPSSVGLWAGAFAEELLDGLTLADAAYRLNDASPLGSAASYGVPLPLDRKAVADALGFGRVQNNVLYVNNSRGRVEAVVLEATEYLMLTLSRLAQDLILFSLPELGYFSLPEEICSGSSIMPQKRNPDMLELIRARTATLGGHLSAVKGVVRALPSGYNRDLQETKAPLFAGMEIVLGSLAVMSLVVEKLQVNQEQLERGFRAEIYATDRVLELVAGGTPFRDAYREVGESLDKLEPQDPGEALRRKSYPGAPGNLNLEEPRAESRRRRQALERRCSEVARRLDTLAGFPVSVYRGLP